MLTEGMYVADRYEILDKIGTGGMSDVFKAMDHVLGRSVAIKVLKQEFSEDVNFVTKFRSEAHAAAGLEHPNIVNIYDVGSENGMYYIVMECVEGITLKDYIEKKGQLTYKEAVSIAIQVGRGIEAAHNKHIVHRDIKPQNIMISTEGKVKVTDFGIARAASSNTIHSDVMGSVHYTSPEQARNGFVDGKSDIYSLGIVMYEMVTGRVPFDGDSTVAIAIQHLQDEMPNPSMYAPNLPISLEKIILKCTQKSPDRRYDSISDLLVDLKKVLISPDEDFVTMVPVGQDKTKVISNDDVEMIKRENSRVYYNEDDEDLDEDEDEDEDEEGGLLNPKMEKAVTIMGIVAAAIIVIIIFCILGSVFGWFKFGGGDDKDKNKDPNPSVSTDEGKKEMIDLLGMTEKEARDALKELNLGVHVAGYEASDDYEKDEIIRQSAEKGEMVEEHTTIEVTLCSGPEEHKAPSVIGKSETEAERIIKDAGLLAKRDFVASDTVAEGMVVSQTPDVGETVKKGDTVTYFLSSGPATYRVPDVTNKSEEKAREELKAAGFENIQVTSETHNTIAEGNVIRQSPEGGEYKGKDISISLVVSLGKDKKYYKYSKTYKKPTEAQTGVDPNLITSWKIEFNPEESDADLSGYITSVDDNGSSITIQAENIPDVEFGVLLIIWEIPVLGEDGMPTGKFVDSKPEEYHVRFTQFR